MRRLVVLVFVLAGVQAAAQQSTLPNRPDSVKFAVIGDSGTGSSAQTRIARQMAAWRERFPFEFVVMLGDNLYGNEDPDDYREKFEIPYKPLLDADVRFYASLGNHDEPNQIYYKPFNMDGRKYYTFKPSDGVRFFALDSNYVDRKQLEWLDKELAASGSEWKIAFFHHPLYSSGETHGSADLQRGLLEPIFIKHGVNVVLAGHEHFYERIKPQKGIAYFILGNSAKLRKGDIRRTSLTAAANDRAYAFMLMEVAGNDLYFQTITDAGQTIDSGVIHRIGKVEPDPRQTTQPVQQVTGAPARDRTPARQQTGR